MNIAVLLELEDASDSRLQDAVLDRIGENPAFPAMVREAVIGHVLSGRLRVVAVLPVETAKTMMSVLDRVHTDLGSPPRYPHADYVTDRR